MTESPRESPGFVKLSLAADMVLGFRRGRFWRNARMTCVNLLLTYANGCRANCSYCGLARDREAVERTFIHVPWPTRSMNEIVAALCASRVARRTCISMLTHPRACEDTLLLARRLVGETPQPVSILLTPTITNKEYLIQLREAGVDKIGIAIDAATEPLFAAHRGKPAQGPHRWEVYWERFAEAVEVFGAGKVGSHFIVGLGEREEDLARAFQRVHDLGGVNHLFSFFPEPGSRLGALSPPPLDVYRRAQFACHLIDEGRTRPEAMRFDPETGRILDFGVAGDVLESALESGEAFRTRGCKGCDGQVDCNRPFGNSYPGPELRNYPFAPDAEDLARIREQLNLDSESRYPPAARTRKQSIGFGGRPRRAVVFSVPGFKHYDTDFFSNRGRPPFHSLTLTGTRCELHCEHCQGKLLQPMQKALTPEALWDIAVATARRNGAGLLLSGGCTREGIVPLIPFAETIGRIKRELPLRVAVHSKLLTRPLAEALAPTGLDAVMVDIIGSENALHHVYHLRNKSLADIEETIRLLNEFRLPAAPHLLLGLPERDADGAWNTAFTSFDAEHRALEMLGNLEMQSLVFVFLMPLPGTPLARPPLPPLAEVNAFFARARRAFPDTPLHLGCARPPGVYQRKLEMLALKHGFEGIAFPAEETIALARRRGYAITFADACCALTTL